MWTDAVSKTYRPRSVEIGRWGRSGGHTDEVVRALDDVTVTLAAGESDAFRPEPFTSLYQRSLFQSMKGQVRPTMQMLRRVLPDLDVEGVRLAERLDSGSLGSAPTPPTAPEDATPEKAPTPA